jgi:hypothetical protein
LLPGAKWSGFEISEQRVALCMWHEHVSVWHGDCLREHYAEFNVLHINDLMFDDDLAMQLESKIAREFSGLLIAYRAITCPALRRISRLIADVSTVRLQRICCLSRPTLTRIRKRLGPPSLPSKPMTYITTASTELCCQPRPSRRCRDTSSTYALLGAGGGGHVNT